MLAHPTDTSASFPVLTILDNTEVVRLPLHDAIQILQVSSDLLDLGVVKLHCIILRLSSLSALLSSFVGFQDAPCYLFNKEARSNVHDDVLAICQSTRDV